MSNKKTFIVDKSSFKEEFLTAISKFKASCEFLPIHFVDGKLTVFCNHRVKEKKGSVGLYIEYEPESSTLENGDVFYVKNPAKLEKTMSLVESDRLVFTVTASHIRAEGDHEKFSFRLYDPILASKDRTFWKPSKFGVIRGKINDGVRLEKAIVEKIQKACNYITDDISCIEFDNDEDTNYLYIGNANNDSFRMKIPFYDGFSNFSKFSKHLFSVVNKNEVNLGETDDKKIITLKDSTARSTKFCFVTKFSD